MNPQSTDQVSESTNNLNANVVTTGIVSFAAADFTDTGTTIGDSPAREAYYGTKTVNLNISSDQVPFITVWQNFGNNSYANTYYKMPNYSDYENPYEKWDRAWYTLTKTTVNGRSVYQLNIFSMTEPGNFEQGQTFFYGITSANFSEVSGL